MTVTPALLDAVEPLAARFVAAGHRLYLVGGVVRDQLLGRPLGARTDIDLTTDAEPPVIKELVRDLASAVWTQGERFGTIGCRIGGRDYEITTHRGEHYESHSRKPHVAYSDSIEDDLARRDFTVNAMAVAVPGGRLIDPYGGEADLSARRLRTPMAPEVSFADDPLRMLRAARFIAGYELVADAALLAAVRAMGARLEIVSVERRRDELEKLLQVADPRRGLEFLRVSGLAVHVVPGSVVLDLDDPAVVDRVCRVPPHRLVRLSALWLDPLPGAPARVRAALVALRASNDDVRRATRLTAGAVSIRTHDRPWSDAAVRRLAHATGDDLDDAIALAAADVAVDELCEARDALAARESLVDFTPALDGAEVMKVLGVGPGRAVGAALDFLTDVRLDAGVVSADEARARLATWWAEHSRRPDRR
jgi:poly(A) polymerase